MANTPSPDALREMRLRRFGTPSSASSSENASSTANTINKRAADTFSPLDAFVPLDLSYATPSRDRERELGQFRKQWTKEIHKTSVARQKATEAESPEAIYKRELREVNRREYEESNRRPTLKELEELAKGEAEAKLLLRRRLEKMDDEKREHYRRTWVPVLDEQIARWTSEAPSTNPGSASPAEKATRAFTNIANSSLATHEALGVTEILEVILSKLPSGELQQLKLCKAFLHEEPRILVRLSV